MAKPSPIWKRMYSYKYTEYDMKCATWCINQDIHISPLPILHDGNNFYIDIIIKGKISRSPKKFTVDETVPKIYEYYRFYYEKSQNKKEVNS